jgi:hypothetical protein
MSGHSFGEIGANGTKIRPLTPVLPDAGVNSSPNRIRNLHHVANFPQINSRIIAPMIDRMKPAV